MYKVGDKVLYRDSEMHNVWHEGIIRARGMGSTDHWSIDGVVKDVVWRYERDIKPRTSPNELTVVVNIDASAAIAEVDKLIDMMRERMATVVNIACKGDVRAAADLVRERDALREELAACKRERDATVIHLEARVNDITWERDEARTKLANANAEAAGRGRACDDLRAECEAMRKERDGAKAAVAEAVARLADFRSQLRTALGYLAREEDDDATHD